jgi:type VI protein secretion system component VasK
MRRLLAWLGLAAGALAFWRWRLRRRRAAPPAAVDPAEELKQRLAESRSDEPAAEAAAQPEEPQPSLDERRRAVHDRARQAMDDMLDGEGLPGEESD